jgi:hypothetical protein
LAASCKCARSGLSFASKGCPARPAQRRMNTRSKRILFDDSGTLGVGEPRAHDGDRSVESRASAGLLPVAQSASPARGLPSAPTGFVCLCNVRRLRSGVALPHVVRCRCAAERHSSARICTEASGVGGTVILPWSLSRADRRLACGEGQHAARPNAGSSSCVRRAGFVCPRRRACCWRAVKAPARPRRPGPWTANPNAVAASGSVKLALGMNSRCPWATRLTGQCELRGVRAYVDRGDLELVLGFRV